LHLTGVTQGSQTRTFVYSSLSRLTSATNPESHTINYTYDNNGNLTSKSDQRPAISGNVTASMTYDQLNRVKTKTYNDGKTPNIYYYYDAQTLPSGAPTYTHGASYGRLLAVTYGTSSSSAEGNYYGYDLLGEVVTKVQRTNSTNYTISASYNKAGEVTSDTYPSPSSRVVNKDYDDAGRITKIHGPSNSPYYAGSSTSTIQYMPNGALQQQTLGNGLIHSIIYNSRMQPTYIELGTSGALTSALELGYTYGTTSANNGNVTAATISAGSQTINQDFTYDSLNRLTMAEETNGSHIVWQQNFGYDRYGNRSKLTASSTGTSESLAVGSVSIGGELQCSEDTLFGCSGSDSADSGYITIQINSYETTAYYDGSTNNTSHLLAVALANNLNSDDYSPVTATVFGSTLNLTARGVDDVNNGNYDVSLIVAYDDSDFDDPSFTAAASDSTLTGGTDAISPTSGQLPDNNFSATDNRVIEHTFDATGNVIYDGRHHYFYDAENRLVLGDYVAGASLYSSVTNRPTPTHPQPAPVNLGFAYHYDGEGRRISTSQTNRYMVYGIGGELLMECDMTSGSLKKEYIYGVNGLLATVDSTNGTLFLTADHLGSIRMITNSSGAVYSKHDYMPFGEEILIGPGTYPYNIRSTSMQYLSFPQDDSARQQFTSKERDAETGLDYFEARYYSNSQGRFTSSDPLYIEMKRLSDPQQLNLYAYTRNNPLKFTDPTGLDISVDGARADDYYKRLQQDASFKISNEKGKVIIVDAKGNKLSNKDLKALGKTLSGGDKEIFNAITDTKHHVTIHAIDGATDSSILFGNSDHHGTHTIAFGQAELLDQPQNAGGVTSAQLVGHETLEGYYESTGMSHDDAHVRVNPMFPGFNEFPKFDTSVIQGGTLVIGMIGNTAIAGTKITENYRYIGHPYSEGGF